ncbi:tryptophan synthase subunit alpha [Geoglobus acetivorans]|uniref:Tryptophan synthase alpha chain n=1 Tax=Geoglobus acetivorans TaxID=565033 RepID=A0ABZ3H302_GEOAI|nr:tryptophan synthase subunit alpha [Geoglobus acetivorans]
MLDRSLVTFITAGDPSLKKTLDFMLVLERYSDVIELGIPFSDPVADGSVIQKANFRALKNGFKVRDVFEIVREFREQSEKKVVLMTYYNPVFRMGVEKFIRLSAEAGVDGIIAVDLPADSSREYVGLCRKFNIRTIFIASPNTTDERLRVIDEASTGFVYLTSDYGTTGKRDRVGERAFDLLKRAKKTCMNPVGVGFGVSKADHVRSLIHAGADGVIVGSAIMELVERYGENADENIEERVRELGRGLG